MSEYAVLPATGAPGGGGTEYVEDAASPANPTAPAISLRRRDAPASEVTTAGDWITANATPYGSMFVQIVTSTGAFVDSFGGAGGTSMADDAVFTPATTNITPFGAYYDDTSPDNVDEGDGGVVRMSADRILYSQTPDRTATGTLGALNAAVTVALTGRAGAGFYLTGTATLTVVAEVSYDGGTVWSVTRLLEPSGGYQLDSLAFTGAASSMQTIPAYGGATHARVRVSAYTSGSLTATVTATEETNGIWLMGRLEDEPGFTGDPGQVVFGQRNDGAAARTSTDGDYGTIALDSAGRVGIADLGGAITVDAVNLDIRDLTHVSDSVKIGDGTLTATIRDTGTSDSLNVAIVDASGNQITSFGGGTEYTEDVAAAADPVGNASILIRQDTPAGLTTADGDNVARRGTNFGAAYTQIITSAGAFVDTFGGGTQYTEGDVDATITGTAAMMEVAGNALQPVQGTVADGLLVNLGANNDITVTGTVTVDTEMPGALALADGMANPTAPAVGAFILGWDGGSQWERVQVGGGTEAAALRVTVASDSTGVLSVDDNAGSLTVDGTVTVTATNLDIRDLDVTTDDVRVAGMAAWDAGVTDNPVAVGVRTSTVLPAAVSADGDAAFVWGNRNGAVVVAVSPHIGLNSDPYNLIHETAQYTTTQTSTVLVAGGASEKLVVTKVQIQVGGTTAGTLQLYFGTAAYSRGTSRAIFDGEFAPSATLKPGVVMDGPWISGTNGDDLLVTTSAAINPLTITVWYYVVT